MTNFKRLAFPLTCLSLGFACAPSSNTGPNTCVNAIAGAPDGSVNPVCQWTDPCDAGTSGLEAVVNALIDDAGGCSQDTDCVFITDGGAFSYDNYTEGFVNPVALANVENLQQAVESVICGYQTTCTVDGGGELISVGVQGTTPQSALCLTCTAGRCVGNPPIPDSGS